MADQPAAPARQPPLGEPAPAEPTLAEVQAEFPAWQCAQGISELFYAQHRPTGIQVTGEDPLDLRDQIKIALARMARQHEPGPAGML